MPKVEKAAANANGWTPKLTAIITAAAAANASGKLTNADCKALLTNPELAKADKNLPAIRGKASSLKIYQSGTKAKPESGENVVRKADLVRAIETMVSMPVNSLDTAEKMSKAELVKLSEQLTKLSDGFNADSVE